MIRRSVGRAYRIACADCGSSAPLAVDACPLCAGPLIALLAPVSCIADVHATAAPRAVLPGIWSRAGFLPRVRTHVSLGEGTTPLIAWEPPPGDRGGAAARIWLKLETVNPTLSFKDRAMALGASVAVERGLGRLVVASTGNAAVSAAAYAAAAGLGCTVVVGSSSEAAAKLGACRAYGAQVNEIPGDYSTAYARAQELSGADAMNVSTTYQNPLLAEAYRGIAAELVEQLGRSPSAVVVPIGAGPLLRGIGVGFAELSDLGLIPRAPRLIGVQAAACAPLAGAWGSGDWRASLGAPPSIRPTRATAIADALRGYEYQGLLTLEAVSASGGAVVAVSEEAIRMAEERLRAAGHWVEPSAATALAALDEPAARKILSGSGTAAAGPDDPEPDRDIVLMMTGHGIKVSAE